jgi:HD-GYP domain-containing protein (c-di-GMP phosphodiesterase class II)
MLSIPKKISLIYFIVATLLMVGLVPLVLTGWFLSERSGRELRIVENRYQTQLVQEKAQQMEMFGKRYTDLVSSISVALELSDNLTVLSSAKTEQKLLAILQQNPSLVALSVKPMKADSFSVFRSEVLPKSKIDAISADAESALGNKKLMVTPPMPLEQGGSVLAFAAPVTSGGSNVATIIAIVSLKEFSRSVVGVTTSDEATLWHSGLPIVFVVNPDGTALFHPDPSLVAKQSSLANLKIVKEWQESNRQVQSALVPFVAEYDGETHHMIGAYSTANLGPNLNFGVITMQDERTALASVADMRNKTWLISLTFACFALLVGLFGARMLTSPLLRLVAAAQKIAAGDFSSRVETRNITEIGTLGQTFNVMSDKLEEHIAKLATAAKENRELFVGTVKALAAAIDGKDKYTRGHSERVARISVAIGRRMDLPEDDLETLRISALLHDVGKIAIDDNILKKPAALTDDEFQIMKTHPQKGYKIMSQIPAMKDFLPGMYMHHEMINGKGYPQGLTGDQIPLQAKIVSVADTFDAMTIDRPYQKALMLDDALGKIEALVGSRYDKPVVDALIAACRMGEVANGIVRQKVNAAEQQEERLSSRSSDNVLPINPDNPLEISF